MSAKDDVIKNVENVDSKTVEWKKTLSGALSDEQLYLAMFVLSVFYFFYTLYNAWLDSDEKDEGDVVRNCTCKDSHRIFYLSWSITCFFLWFILHTCFVLARAFPAVTKSLKQKCVSHAYKCVGKYVQICKTDDGAQKVTDHCIRRYEKFLWSQSYEMYAVGKKREQKFSLKEIEKSIVRLLRSQQDNSNKEDSQEDTDYGYRHQSQKFRGNVVRLFHLFLMFVQFITQLAVIPLLIVQMFDTYTLLCLAERDYCDRTSQFRLHLDQTALTFSFYCCLMISFLVTKWLDLVPWPKSSTLCNKAN